ncbi:transposase domain protein [Mycobacterium avium MAV_120809_2495]|nr:transposase domain protein [Mycobacterium avium MAV_120809_2495]
MTSKPEERWKPGVKRPGFPGGSGYWIPIKGWSVRYAS